MAGQTRFATGQPTRAPTLEPIVSVKTSMTDGTRTGEKTCISSTLTLKTEALTMAWIAAAA
jgi:hypothetical protein